MHLLTDDRAQAIQVGAVLLFGILILFLSLYQAFVVPDQNEKIEFDHNERVQKQLAELRSNVVLMPGSTSTRAVSIDLGVRYPSRAIFVNPGPASGTLRTIGTQNERVNITIDNATAVRRAETADFWNGTARSFNTGAIEYEPQYNLYSSAPRTVYEHSLVYNHFENDGTTQAVTGQTLIDGNRISLIALNGSLSESRVRSLSLDLRPVSTRSRVVEVKNDSGPITLSFPTGLSESEWNSTLEDEWRNGNVMNVSSSAFGGSDDLRLLEVTLEPGRYELKLTKVGVGTRVQETSGQYLTDIEGNDSRVEVGETRELTLEVRDEFNVPQSGVQVDASAAGGSFENNNSETSKMSDTEGQATFRYQPPPLPPGTSTTVDVRFTIDPGYTPDPSHDPRSPTNVTMTVEAFRRSTGTGGGGGGPYNTSFNISQISQEAGFSCGPDSCTYDLANDTDGKFNLSAFTSPTAVGADVDFALNTTSSGDFTSASDDQTDSNGEAVGVFDVTGTGAITAYVTSGGGGDTIEINLTNSADDTVFSALSPDPQAQGRGSDVEFIRVYFPSNTNTTGWTIADDEGSGQTTDLPTETLQGEVYFAKDPDMFATYWSIDPGNVYKLDTLLNNGGEPLKLNNSNGVIVDQVAYESETTTNGWSLTLSNGDIGVRRTPGGTYIDTDNASDWRVENENDFFAGGNGGFQTVEATSIVPDADEQTQSFVFRLDDDLPSTEEIDIDVSEAQGTGPVKVDYSSGNIFANRSLSARNIGSGTITVGFINDLSAGETIRVNVTNIAVGAPGDQTDPYSVTFQRSDVASNRTDSFRVDPNDGDAKLASVTATDLVTSRNGQVQTINFTLDGDIQNGEIVTIDLSDAQSTSGGTQVDYQKVNPFTLVSGSGTINEDTNSDVSYLRYTAGASDTDGDTIEVELDGVDTGPDSAQNDPYEVGVSRGDADTKSANFTVYLPPNFQVTIEGTNSPVVEGEGLEVNVTVTNTGDRQDTQNVELRDFNSNLVATRSVTLNDGQSTNFNLTWSTGTGDAGSGDVNASSEDDFDTQTVTVDEPAFFNVTIDSVNSSVAPGDTVVVNYTVENTGDVSGNQIINFDVNGTTNDTESVTLADGATFNGLFNYTTGSGDTPAIEVNVSSDDDSDRQSVVVQQERLSGASVTDIVPNADEQMQTFNFTVVNTNLPVDEKVVIELDEAQAVGQTLIDYSSASVNDVNDGGAGGDASIDTNSGETTLNYTAPSGGTPAGTEIGIRVTSIKAWDSNDQSNPYTVPFSRTDTGAGTSAQFSASLQNGTAELGNISVTDLVGTSEQEQLIRFTPQTDMVATGNGPEILTIDLSDAQSGAVDYSSASVQSASPGSAGVNTDTGVAYIKYEANGGVSAGTTVEITLESVNPTGTGTTYQSGFSRGTADTTNVSFNVTSDQQVLNFKNVNTGQSGTLNFKIQSSVKRQVTVTDFAIDANDLGNNPTLDNSNSNEVEINPPKSGTDGFANRSGAYTADGTEYTLDQDAIIPNKGNTDIIFEGLSPSTFDLDSVTNEAEADIVVTLFLSNGPPQKYYFEDTN